MLLYRLMSDEGEIVDPDLKRAQLMKMSIDALVSALVVVIYARFLLSDDVKSRMRRAFMKWRRSFFGPPPLTEEQIREAERQTVVEALKVLRSDG